LDAVFRVVLHRCESGTSCEFDRHFIALALPLAFLREQRVQLLLGLQTQRQVLERLFYEGLEQWLCRLVGAAKFPVGARVGHGHDPHRVIAGDTYEVGA
jgi:hypothetical protein